MISALETELNTGDHFVISCVVDETVIQLLKDNYIIVIVSAVIVTFVLLCVIREISLHRRLNGNNFRSAIRSRSYRRSSSKSEGTVQKEQFQVRRSSSKSQVNSNADALPVNDKELPSPHIMEHMVTFKRKLKKGKTRQRWSGILKSDKDARMIYTYLQEHLSGGNVRTFLETQYGQYYLHGNIDALVPSAFFRFALNITSGVHFLHSHGWVCPGITAGKVLIDQARTLCKLYDFCPLSYTGRKVENELRKNRPIPFINLPPEVFQDKVYTRYSDIWAVGVVLWEIFSYGAWPPTHENVKDRQDVLLKLKRPGNCSENVYHALANCWLFDQSSRQSLQVLEECLESNKTDSSLSARAMNIEDIYTVGLPPYSGFAKVENSSDI
ncbi:hypothetical protein BSL78_11431 [Apostichopus japonicus]|uniref:Protein kinase domain-containing protein n=1 Tax=Stichopus japonicus TaxID=307972 RepID=A0A2G8KUI7_STIJA|nr:hypothetical protein BSL78_11431 [Apostichopus japonicus]